MTRVFYFVDADNQRLSPVRTVPPASQSVVAKVITSLGYQAAAYTGNHGDLVMLESLYSVVLYSGNLQQNVAQIQNAVLQAWNSSGDGKCFVFSISFQS